MHYFQLHALELITDDVLEGSEFYAWLFEPRHETPAVGTILRSRGVSVVQEPGPGDTRGWRPVFRVENVLDAEQRGVSAGFARSTGTETIRYMTDQGGRKVGLIEISESTDSETGEASPLHNLLLDYWTSVADDVAIDYATMLDCEVLHVLDDPYDMRLLHHGPWLTIGVATFGTTRLESTWIPYFHTFDLAFQVARAVEAGAKIRVPIGQIATTDSAHFAVLEDPFGQIFGLTDWVPESRKDIPVRQADGTVTSTQAVLGPQSATGAASPPRG